LPKNVKKKLKIYETKIAENFDILSVINDKNNGGEMAVHF
jgi:hypothetical protein